MKTKSVKWCLSALLLATCVLDASSAERMVGMGVEKDSIPFSQVIACGLPVLDIATVDGEWPDGEYVRAPSGYSGKSIINATNVPGRMKLYEQGVVTFDTGDFLDGVRGMKIKIRGNSSAFGDKKPYKLTLQQKADLMFRNNPSYRDKDWLLIRDDMLKTMQGFEINRLLGMAWTPAYRYVNVVINDDYQGIYMLVESVKRNVSCRLSVAKDGFIVEHDTYWWTESYHVISHMYQGRHYTFKYPDADELTRADKTFIKERLDAYETSINNGTYPEYLDVMSMAKWCLGQDLLATSDAGGVNRFYTLNDRQPGTLLVVPLMWDFDSAEFNEGRWSRPHLVLMGMFFNNVNRAFVDAYVSAWQEVSPGLPTKMMSLFANFTLTPEGKGFAASIDLNNLRWDTQFLSGVNLSDRGFWFYSRVAWLEKAIGKLNPPYDVDINGVVDVSDLNQLINMMIHKVPTNLRVADFNHDGDVDTDDMNILVNVLIRKLADS
ncbi:MAG: CotH kinase family protein [Muribaculaceae bacterium]|nr:CotH kinase family protein [Muribaculaceae bacterium]